MKVYFRQFKGECYCIAYLDSGLTSLHTFSDKRIPVEALKKHSRPSNLHECRDLMEEIKQVYTGEPLEFRTHTHNEVKKSLGATNTDLAFLFGYNNPASYTASLRRPKNQDLLDRLFHRFILGIKQ